MERRTGKIRRTFSRMHRALDGWMLAIARRFHQLKASTTMDPGISIFHFLYDVWPEKLGIVGSQMKTTVINMSCLYILLYNTIYSTRFYVIMWHEILYFLQNVLIPLFY